MKRSIKLLFIILFLSQIASGQKIKSKNDYERALSFLSKNINNKKVFNLYVKANWFPDSTGVWYVNRSPESKKYIGLSFSNLKKYDLFDHQKLADLLSDSLKEEIDADDLPITRIEHKNRHELLITVKGKQYIFNTLSQGLITHKAKDKSNKLAKSSPDNKWIAFSKDYNLHIKSTEKEEIKRLSSSGKKDYEYASFYGWYDIMEGENGERPEQFGLSWSPDGEWIHADVCDLRTARKMYLLDWSVDSLYRPKLLSYYRGSPGDTGMIYMEPAFFNINTGEEIRPDLPRSTHINQISVRWSKTPGKVYLERSSRGYQNLNIYSFDLKTEKLQSIYSESSKTNIDNFSFRLAETSNKLFFLSEKNGWRQLYSLNLKNQKEKRITSGNFYVNSIDRIDEEKQMIFFRASGKEKDSNPYYQKLYSVSFSGKDLKLLGSEDCNHIIDFSPDGNYFVDNFSTVNIETKTVLRSSETGAILLEIASANLEGLEGWSPPEIFTVLAHDGKTSLYGALWKPGNFDLNKKYPIIDHSYTGPHTQVFPKDFSRAFSNQALAELGFIVMSVDGLGSSGRSKEFHNYSYKNLGGNLEDHVGAIRQLGNLYSWIDTTRVGIFGHSAGGYDAGHAVLAYPDFYKVAVASSADHDHRMEKAWWPEMYMGWPVDSAYHLQSNITMAGSLKGKLLIIHGGIDDNVNPSATFKLAEALVRADKQFDMLILPSQRHGYIGDFRNYFTKLKWNYFVEHLLDEEPVWDFKWE